MLFYKYFNRSISFNQLRFVSSFYFPSYQRSTFYCHNRIPQKYYKENSLKNLQIARENNSGHSFGVNNNYELLYTGKKYRSFEKSPLEWNDHDADLNYFYDNSRNLHDPDNFDYIKIDFHGLNLEPATQIMHSIFLYYLTIFVEMPEEYRVHVDLIVGRGLRSENGPVLGPELCKYLNRLEIKNSKVGGKIEFTIRRYLYTRPKRFYLL